MRAAIQQVRDRTAHTTTCPSRDWETALPGDPMWARREPSAREKLELCACDWAARIDARLAACVEAALVGESVRAFAFDAAETERRVIREAGLAAFLAAAAQKEQ